ncbi:hypothetical protein [Pseudomonas sp. SCB32]|uniref:hypothetical protein n=1 Tax=Pseudomonas sp. SCB32 TaxID=2653853 RepID=UPI001263F6C3|nr:hypothetical protein [Pseudomonas sp. SCB32]
MKLRKEIENTIREANEDRANAALAICLLLESKLGLSEQGWFDDDPLLQNEINLLKASGRLKAQGCPPLPNRSPRAPRRRVGRSA